MRSSRRSDGTVGRKGGETDMDGLLGFLDGLRGTGYAATAFKLGLAVIFGGVIGLERRRKRRPAGFRTHILVCMGAALAVCISYYISEINAGSLVRTDVSRLGAQVINGIGFLGAGTIIVTGRQQVKGLTTAAGLWASACMGLAIGAGYFECGILACVAIYLTITVFNSLEKLIMSRTFNMNVNVMVTETACLKTVLDKLHSMDVKIFDVEITNVRELRTESPNVIIEVRLPTRRHHVDIITAIASLDGIIAVEEL